VSHVTGCLFLASQRNGSNTACDSITIEGRKNQRGFTANVDLCRSPLVQVNNLNLQRAQISQDNTRGSRIATGAAYRNNCTSKRCNKSRDVQGSLCSLNR